MSRQQITIQLLSILKTQKRIKFKVLTKTKSNHSF